MSEKQVEAQLAEIRQQQAAHSTLFDSHDSYKIVQRSEIRKMLNAIDYLLSLQQPVTSERCGECQLCGHEKKWLANDGTCRFPVPICSDDYHGTRPCGCKCEFPTGAVTQSVYVSEHPFNVRCNTCGLEQVVSLQCPREDGQLMPIGAGEGEQQRVEIAAPPPAPWELRLYDRADGVKGHYCVGRYNPAGYHEFWNEDQFCSAGEVFTDRAMALLKARELSPAPTSAQLAAAPQDEIATAEDGTEREVVFHWGKDADGYPIPVPTRVPSTPTPGEAARERASIILFGADYDEVVIRNLVGNEYIDLILERIAAALPPNEAAPADAGEIERLRDARPSIK